MRTGQDFKSAQFGPVRGEASDWTKLRRLEILSSPRTGPSCGDLKSSPVRIGGFGTTSKTNELSIISNLWTGQFLIQS